MQGQNHPKLKMSYVCGVSAPPLRYQTVGQNLDEAVRKWGARNALVVRHQNVRWTYKEFGERVDGFAAGLAALGLEPGDRVGIWAPNCWEWTVVQFATAKLGLILVNINPAYRLTELEFSLNWVECKALILADRHKSSDYVAMVRDLAPEISESAPGKLKAARLPQLRIVIRIGEDRTPGFYNFGDIFEMATDAGHWRVAELEKVLQADDPINIQFTSGTTGQPKGATLTHFNILNNAANIVAAMRITENDRFCVPFPLYHCAGMVGGNLGAVAVGACIIYASEAFDPTAVLETVAAEKCTVLGGVPTMFIAELDHPDFAKFDLRSLRTGLIGAAPCPVELMKRLIGQMYMREVTIAYGMTETSPVSFQTSPDDSLERRVGTVGRIHPHVEAKIIDGEGRVTPTGQRGEILTRGYSIMKGYWNDPDKTREAIDEAGWMHTGDLGVLDDAGYLNIVGRVKDMVIRGGENIFPREIEDFLYRHDKIQEVSVFGVPDAKLGEELCAWIRLRSGATASPEEIAAFCKGQIAHYKIPRYVHFVDAFPMTVSGKIQKFVMRDQMITQLDLKVQKTA